MAELQLRGRDPLSMAAKRQYKRDIITPEQAAFQIAAEDKALAKYVKPKQSVEQLRKEIEKSGREVTDWLSAKATSEITGKSVDSLFSEYEKFADDFKRKGHRIKDASDYFKAAYSRTSKPKKAAERKSAQKMSPEYKEPKAQRLQRIEALKEAYEAGNYTGVSGNIADKLIAEGESSILSGVETKGKRDRAAEEAAKKKKKADVPRFESYRPTAKSDNIIRVPVEGGKPVPLENQFRNREGEILSINSKRVKEFAEEKGIDLTGKKKSPVTALKESAPPPAPVAKKSAPKKPEPVKKPVAAKKPAKVPEVQPTAAEVAKVVSMKDTAGNDTARKIADSYIKSAGLNQSRKQFNDVNPDFHSKVAAAYDSMKHSPNDPNVKKAYDALISETLEQFKLLQNSGLKLSRIPPGMENPYKSSKDLHEDVKKNKHMWYYPTESGFGESGKPITEHPMLKATAATDGKNKLLANDVFRIVHDYFGHIKEGTSFGPRGEETAYRIHKQMYSPEAQKALLTETRGQNSWVNFGPKGEFNRKNPKQTIYADQKAGILPEWALSDYESADEKIKTIPQEQPPKTLKAVEPPKEPVPTPDYNAERLRKAEEKRARKSDVLKSAEAGFSNKDIAKIASELELTPKQVKANLSNQDFADRAVKVLKEDIQKAPITVPTRGTINVVPKKEEAKVVPKAVAPVPIDVVDEIPMPKLIVDREAGKIGLEKDIYITDSSGRKVKKSSLVTKMRETSPPKTPTKKAESPKESVAAKKPEPVKEPVAAKKVKAPAATRITKIKEQGPPVSEASLVEKAAKETGVSKEALKSTLEETKALAKSSGESMETMVKSVKDPRLKAALGMIAAGLIGFGAGRATAPEKKKPEKEKASIWTQEKEKQLQELRRKAMEKK